MAAERSPRLVIELLYKRGPLSNYSFNSQPLRKTGLTNLLASALLVKRIAFASQSSLPGTCRAMAVSANHSAYGAVMLKSEQLGSPPFEARTQSSM